VHVGGHRNHQIRGEGEVVMGEIARASLSNGKKSGSVLELAWTGEAPRTDRDGRNDRDLVEYLEAENLALRSWAVQLALQIQSLRRVGSSETRSANRSRV
jgi:hypothetical protein